MTRHNQAAAREQDIMAQAKDTSTGISTGIKTGNNLPVTD